METSGNMHLTLILMLPKYIMLWSQPRILPIYVKLRPSVELIGSWQSLVYIVTQRELPIRFVCIIRHLCNNYPMCLLLFALCNLDQTRHESWLQYSCLFHRFAVINFEFFLAARVIYRATYPIWSIHSVYAIYLSTCNLIYLCKVLYLYPLLYLWNLHFQCYLLYFGNLIYLFDLSVHYVCLSTAESCSSIDKGCHTVNCICYLAIELCTNTLSRFSYCILTIITWASDCSISECLPYTHCSSCNHILLNDYCSLW